MPKDFSRTRRIAHLLQREIASLLPEIRGLREITPVLPTITGVDIAPGMRSARVFFSLLNGPERAHDVAGVLDHAGGFIRHHLGKRLDLWRIPDLKFEYDGSFDEGARMSQLIQQARDSGSDSDD